MTTETATAYPREIVDAAETLRDVAYQRQHHAVVQERAQARAEFDEALAELLANPWRARELRPRKNELGRVLEQHNARYNRLVYEWDRSAQTARFSIGRFNAPFLTAARRCVRNALHENGQQLHVAKADAYWDKDDKAARKQLAKVKARRRELIQASREISSLDVDPDAVFRVPRILAAANLPPLSQEESQTDA